MSDMITSIPEGQLCEAFDSMLIFKEKTEGLTETLEDGSAKASTSCICPAYVYLEGIHGKRFLCDFHYFFEYNITIHRTPELWPNISKVFIDEREKIKETFPESNGTIKDLGPCWCGGKSYVEIVNFNYEDGKKERHIQYFCNFHWRKLYWRYLNHGVDLYTNGGTIHDQRFLMTESIDNESMSLRAV